MSGFSVFGCLGNLSISQEDMDAFNARNSRRNANERLNELEEDGVRVMDIGLFWNLYIL